MQPLNNFFFLDILDGRSRLKLASGVLFVASSNRFY